MKGPNGLGACAILEKKKTQPQNCKGNNYTSTAFTLLQVTVPLFLSFGFTKFTNAVW